MSDPWTIDEVDVDGAIREAADKVDPHTRASFLKKAGIGVGVVAGGSALMGLAPGIAMAGPPASDVAILNFALTLEYLEAAFYAGARSNASAFTGDTRNFVDVVAGHEATHVAFLKKALGSAAVKSPKFDFMGTSSSGYGGAATGRSAGVPMRLPPIAHSFGCEPAPGHAADPILDMGLKGQPRCGARSSMQSGFLWLASGTWASQQSGEQKWRGRRFLLQVETEQQYHNEPNGIGFLHTLQRVHASLPPFMTPEPTTPGRRAQARPMYLSLSRACATLSPCPAP